jgi:putative lipoic acid-binding regulatory protein
MVRIRFVPIAEKRMSNEKDIKLHDLTLEEGETLLKFPCEFPIKAMGLACDALEIAVIEIINRHVEDLAEDALRIKPSKNGKYTAITITITAHSKDQLDAIYMDLTACEHVSIAL